MKTPKDLAKQRKMIQLNHFEEKVKKLSDKYNLEIIRKNITKKDLHNIIKKEELKIERYETIVEKRKERSKEALINDIESVLNEEERNVIFLNTIQKKQIT